MKSLIIAFSLGFLFTLNSCSSSEQNSSQKSVTKKDESMISVKNYPKELNYVFKAHGGIDTWNAMYTLSYDMDKSGNTEHQTIDLKSRKVKIDQDKFTIGYNGQEVWVSQKDTNTYKGDARFYHNLYFYFYAMPFVLGDSGINYETIEPLNIDGNIYPGIKIIYNDGVGDSSKDNYFLYYNPKTYQTEWLGYTVTYFNGQPSQEIHYLHFEQWKKIEGLLLPEILTWYNIDPKNGEKTSRGSMAFKNVKLSKQPKSAAFFDKN